MDCGCTSGKRYEFNFECVPCMARHYVMILGGSTKTMLAQRKARYKQLEQAWPAEKFAEWWKLVEQERKR